MLLEVLMAVKIYIVVFWAMTLVGGYCMSQQGVRVVGFVFIDTWALAEKEEGKKMLYVQLTSLHYKATDH
jgi:hypothetical protein